MWVPRLTKKTRNLILILGYLFKNWNKKNQPLSGNQLVSRINFRHFTFTTSYINVYEAISDKFSIFELWRYRFEKNYQNLFYFWTIYSQFSLNINKYQSYDSSITWFRVQRFVLFFCVAPSYQTILKYSFLEFLLWIFVFLYEFYWMRLLNNSLWLHQLHQLHQFNKFNSDACGS